MNRKLKGVWQHMLGQGLGALAHANRHSCYHDMQSPWWHQQSVLQAAHAGELLIKARIAKEHPLLIFDQLPKPPPGDPTLLDIDDLFERGRTVQWSDLPARLWATTGMRLPNEQIFNDFGRLRNTIQHFSVPQARDLSGETVGFVFQVLDPFIHKCWGLFAVDYDEDSERYVYLMRAIMGREILCNVSPGAAEHAGYWDVDWSAMDPEYRTEMVQRIEAAWQTLATDGESREIFLKIRGERKVAWDKVRAEIKLLPVPAKPKRQPKRTGKQMKSK